MGMTCDNCGKDAGGKEIVCETCVKELNDKIDELVTQLEHEQERYDELFAEYNSPINKFARGEYKKGGNNAN